MTTKSPLYHRHRFPPEIISYCIWLYNSFSLSYRDIEKMMLYRGVGVTYEAIRYLLPPAIRNAPTCNKDHSEPGLRVFRNFDDAALGQR